MGEAKELVVLKRLSGYLRYKQLTKRIGLPLAYYIFDQAFMTCVRPWKSDSLSTKCQILNFIHKTHFRFI